MLTEREANEMEIMKAGGNQAKKAGREKVYTELKSPPEKFMTTRNIST